ncbi:MAG TPA: cytochrome c-type biogenesis protein CcmH [Solirubrobacteraceae bacterium]|nr:cytochrome c-type biogenesis protein CcmH [Solirubrobacteraceae bacterium]
MRRSLVLLLAVLLCAGAALPAFAAAAQPRVSFPDIEDEVMCDTCNVPLNIADSPRADQLRREIKGMIAQGLTKPQIKARLKAEYGPNILPLPPGRGFDLAAYLVPAAVAAGLLLLGVLLVPRWRRRSRSGGGRPDAAAPPISTFDEHRLEEELAQFDG